LGAASGAGLICRVLIGSQRWLSGKVQRDEG
jgi:hypothetical protein